MHIKIDHFVGMVHMQILFVGRQEGTGKRNCDNVWAAEGRKRGLEEQKIYTKQKLSKLQVRKNEIHGLKDILVRENEKIQREQVTLRFYPRFIHTVHWTCCILKIILGVISDKFQLPDEH